MRDGLSFAVLRSAAPMGGKVNAMISTLVAALLTAPAPLPACRINAPASCSDANRLANSAGFDRALRRFLGGRWLLAGGQRQAVARQAIAVLGGPPDQPEPIGPLYRFTACQAHQCSEKGALVVTPAGAIVAVGILHSTCAMQRHGPTCFNDNVLSIYARGERPTVLADLGDWAQHAIAGSYRAPGEPLPRLLRTEVIRVRGTISSARRPHQASCRG
jgi:hypothetical protein